jgi:uncharacterized protein YgiM (DUF1202 family)
MNDPRLVIDISLYDDHVNPAELAGVAAVILKTGGGLRRDPKFVANGTALAQAGIPLMGYYWDDIALDPAHQAEWALDDLAKAGLPIKALWIDQEQWWSNWDEWYAALANKIGWSDVSCASAANISLHNSIFMKTLDAKVSTGTYGVYTSRGFTASWEPQSKSWIGGYNLWVAHYGNQPQIRTPMTWDQLKQNWFPSYAPNLPDGAAPQKLVGHQFTGDRCLLPGVYTADGNPVPLDVSVFDGAFMDKLMASPDVVKGANLMQNQPDTWQGALPAAGQGSAFLVSAYVLNVRQGPGPNNAILGTLTQHQQVTVTSRQGNWALLSSGGWVYAPYLTPVTA